MKISTKIAATVIALCSAATAAAAPATIRSSIDSTTMTMGNKTMIRVAVVKDKSQAGHLIAPQDSIVNEVEVAGEISHSVADLGNGRVQETYVIPVQAFLPGPYVLPGMKYVLEGDTLVGDEMPLKVLDVDTRELEKKDSTTIRQLPIPTRNFGTSSLISVSFQKESVDMVGSRRLGSACRSRSRRNNVSTQESRQTDIAVHSAKASAATIRRSDGSHRRPAQVESCRARRHQGLLHPSLRHCAPLHLAPLRDRSDGNDIGSDIVGCEQTGQHKGNRRFEFSP